MSRFPFDTSPGQEREILRRLKRLAREEPISGAVYSCAAAHGYVYECLVTWTANAVPMRAAWGPFSESVGYAELDLDEDPARIVQRLREAWHSRRAGKSWDPTRGRLGIRDRPPSQSPLGTGGRGAEVGLGIRGPMCVRVWA